MGTHAPACRRPAYGGAVTLALRRARPPSGITSSQKRAMWAVATIATAVIGVILVPSCSHPANTTPHDAIADKASLSESGTGIVVDISVVNDLAEDAAPPEITDGTAAPESALVGDADTAIANPDTATSETLDEFGPDSNQADAGEGTDAAPDDNVPDSTEPQIQWLPAEAPLDCPNLPPICEGRAGIGPGTFNPESGIPGLPLPGLGLDAWSLWRPQRFELTGTDSAVLTAVWINQWLVPTVSQAPMTQVEVLPMMVKPSLLPSACVSVLLKPANAPGKPAWVPAGYAISLIQPSLILTPEKYKTTAEMASSAQCPWKDGDNLDSTKSLSLALPTGGKLTAHPGRASTHLLTDPLADISPLVRDLAVVNGGLGPVLEVTLPGSATPDAIPLDVTVCRATPELITKSGMVCPTEPWLPNDITPVAAPWFRIEAGPLTRTISAEFLAKLAGPGWNGVGMPKSADVWSISACCHACTKELQDWLCTGWAETDQAFARLGELSLLRPKHVLAQMSWSGPHWPIDLPQVLTVTDGVAWLSPFAKGKFLAYDPLRFSEILAPRDVPARQRDGVWERVRIGTATQDGKLGVTGKLTIVDYGPNSAKFEFSDLPYIACRRHFIAFQGPGKSLPVGCVVGKGKLTAHLVVTKPGKPLAP